MDNEVNERDPEHEVFLLDSLSYLESLTRKFGPERAHDVWTAMGDAIGREVQMEVFALMLTGEVGGSRISFRIGLQSAANNAVSTIKIIRNFTGLGLKESKDIWDKARDTGEWTIINSPHGKRVNNRHEVAKELRALGHVVR